MGKPRYDHMNDAEGWEDQARDGHSTCHVNRPELFCKGFRWLHAIVLHKCSLAILAVGLYV